MPEAGDSVRHEKMGVGQVVMDDGQTVVVQFEHGLERCLHAELTPVMTTLQSAEREQWDPPLPVVARVLGESIQSVNDRWGVFSRSRIALLPHQLWVCRRVLDSWPARWLVADDVGLGKTIEAGLILWPVLTRGTVRRLLVICPSSLVPQWQQRLKSMFDIRLAPYVTEADTEISDFWHTHPQVVASLQTLRRKGDDGKSRKAQERRKRMLEAPPWDLLIVDEAHHLNADEKSGPTDGYTLIQELADAGKLQSMVFFTGTPHRGKNFGFLSLLRLLRPDLFDPKRPLHEQLPELRQVMIRNNKQNVTDLKGKNLFVPPKVTSETYSYSEPEERFYAMLSEFITTGKAYASGLSTSEQKTVILVLISMQKLASSSVAAIRRALRNRLAKLQSAQKDLEELKRVRGELVGQYGEVESQNDTDALSALEEQIAELVELSLSVDEQGRLEELLQAADEVTTETKIEHILTSLDAAYADRSVLFFTEYKATQSLLMSALIRRFGDGCVTFINGDGRAEEVISKSGKPMTLIEERQAAAARFNAGEVRFLVSTEAAGEGIDLQEQCFTLIHVDLPWNPMRLHQRVGRLYRYGQQRTVEVLTLRNPSTVESRIWDKLNSKIDRIMTALGEVMDEPEDLLELVLGMASPGMFREVFSGAESIPEGSLASWFDEKTARFGGKDVIDTVRSLVGHCEHFDFQETSERIPKLDLPALLPFFKAMLALNSRRYQEADGELSFKTPDAWMNTAAVRKSYRNMAFTRNPDTEIASILGVGHAAVDQSIQQARSLEDSVTSIPSTVLTDPLVVFRVSERVTSGTASFRSIVAAAEVLQSGEVKVIQDWGLVTRLNSLLEQRTLRRDDAARQAAERSTIELIVERGREQIEREIGTLDVSFTVPDFRLLAVLYPDSLSSDSSKGSFS